MASNSTREYNSRWRAKHRDRLATKRRDLYRENPDKYRAQVRAWAMGHRAEVNARRRADYAINRASIQEALRRSRLARLYQLTPEQYDAMAVAQDGLCAICRKPPQRRRLDIDHDHTTGQVRGLLCGDCNKAIGLLDEISGLRAAIAYLENQTLT